jgi:hypothetical protein
VNGAEKCQRKAVRAVVTAWLHALKFNLFFLIALPCAKFLTKAVLHTPPGGPRRQVGPCPKADARFRLRVVFGENGELSGGCKRWG